MFSSVLLFLNIGGPEMILIVFVALLLFGGEKLPEIARGLGKGIRDFKDASEGVKREITNQINSYEERRPEETAVNTPPVIDPSHELPAATEEHNVSAEAEVVSHEGAVSSPEAVAETHTVANTIPFNENHGLVSEEHINSEGHINGEQHTEAPKTEPVKSTHE
jgi:sec-independent protein translocase protein TatA